MKTIDNTNNEICSIIYIMEKRKEDGAFDWI